MADDADIELDAHTKVFMEVDSLSVSSDKEFVDDSMRLKELLSRPLNKGNYNGKFFSLTRLTGQWKGTSAKAKVGKVPRVPST
eukprot:CAMPEP_0171473196 /NCGR_PEP_ID=MMETSP0946-20130122/1705_1 /TAXON_ID=109269 /ORGANISM="Vaucheria litorea, Strain CCMP2940" /LENGTH=82 /DNA_ID=CAMNT_0012002929 /DNA_START=102 /DNA_END=350 /DNA_ORIENTATION=+